MEINISCINHVYIQVWCFAPVSVRVCLGVGEYNYQIALI